MLCPSMVYYSVSVLLLSVSYGGGWLRCGREERVPGWGIEVYLTIYWQKCVCTRRETNECWLNWHVTIFGCVSSDDLAGEKQKSKSLQEETERMMADLQNLWSFLSAFTLLCMTHSITSTARRLTAPTHLSELYKNNCVDLFQTNWFTRRRNTKLFPRSWIKLSRSCLATEYSRAVFFYTFLPVSHVILYFLCS